MNILSSNSIIDNTVKIGHGVIPGSIIDFDVYW